MRKPKPTHRDLLPLYAVCLEGLAAIAIATIGGCVEVKPELIQLNGETYIQGPATTRAPLPGLPDLGPHQLIPLTPASEKQMTQHIPVWGCTAFDWSTTIVGLALGFAEANPLGLLTVPLAYLANRAATEHAQSGDTLTAKTSSAAHCGAAAVNLAAIL